MPFLRGGLQKLVTIKKDVALDVVIEDLAVGKKNKELLQEIYAELDFKAWLEEEPQKEDVEKAKLESQYELITTNKQLEKWLIKIKESKVLALDTETTGLDYMDSK